MAYTFDAPIKVLRSEPKGPDRSIYPGLCEWYQKHSEYGQDMSHIWSTLRNAFLFDLHEALMDGNFDALAAILESIYDGQCLTGLDVPNEYLCKNGQADSLFQGLLITAANACGVLPVFNTEQPVEKVLNAEKLLRDIQDYLDFDMDTEPCGAVTYAEIGGKRITAKVLYSVPAVCAMDSIRPLADTVVEIGAGVGFCCSTYVQAFKPYRYYIIDLPILTVIQSFFLTHQLGARNVKFYDSSILQDDVVLCGLDMPSCMVDLVLNQNSMPEMPRESQVRYLKWISDHLSDSSSFISINHESNLGDQVRVLDTVQCMSPLTRSIRVPFWPRPGFERSNYVLEVFK